MARLLNDTESLRMALKHEILLNYNRLCSSFPYYIFALVVKLIFSIQIMFSLIPSDANDPQGLMHC